MQTLVIEELNRRKCQKKKVIKYEKIILLGFAPEKQNCRLLSHKALSSYSRKNTGTQNHKVL